MRKTWEKQKQTHQIKNSKYIFLEVGIGLTELPNPGGAKALTASPLLTALIV